ncbi:hypothetical protein FA893_18205 [Photobacterium damselae subsp. piscicida]|uniref:Uncharacterized protein n=1 Tax=Photobacterium damsela subsp. piscicida TaxID=38294 RepID=A0A1Q9GU72_PHODP|nr:hypothetical protein [Photobacterium damselae]MBE8127022.1 hypothetical protein [Photobacterium damselae subsp. piscicida]OLQ78699.1 hypothetical protein BEI67_19040 [Photobacterium damselae subsp. piscicida]PSV55904.1 hypothetical protein CTT35_16330 [Photobacterium damselae]PSW75912.1 hypothetical protein CTT37_16935 [Photobacterium damselae]QOD54207.1 hypothetical protein IC628_19455 [Photobacterium damselae subsp. piscicida]
MINFNTVDLSVEDITTVMLQRKPIATRTITFWNELEYSKKRYVKYCIDGQMANWVCLTYSTGGYRYLLALSSSKKKTFDIYYIGDRKVEIINSPSIISAFDKSMDTHLLLQAYRQLKGEQGTKPSIWKRKAYFTEIYFGLLTCIGETIYGKPKFESFSEWDCSNSHATL